MTVWALVFAMTNYVDDGDNENEKEMYELREKKILNERKYLRE